MQFPPDMVMFDCDGVLVDSETLTADVLLRQLAAYGLSVTRDRLADLFLGGTLPGVAVEARKLGADLPESWVEDTYETVFAALADTVEPIVGVTSVLDRLDVAGIPYAVGSNGPHRKMEITLTRTGLADRLRGRVYSREDVPRPKPAPDLYLKIAADHSVPPARCVVIEDSPSGAKAAQAAGIWCFGYAADTPAERLNPHCDHIFRSMADLPELLGLPPL